MDKITRHAIRAYNYYETQKAAAFNKWAALINDERGESHIPWTMILLVGGAIVAVGIITWAINYATTQTASVPAVPGN
jgi:hypothetical protein